jgi:hypothetical protein
LRIERSTLFAVEEVLLSSKSRVEMRQRRGRRRRRRRPIILVGTKTDLREDPVIVS